VVLPRWCSRRRRQACRAADLQLSTLDYDERGQATITGQAARREYRAYVDDKLVAEGMAGATDAWRLVPAAPIDNGKHKLRLDRLAKDGKPTSRLRCHSTAWRAPVAATGGA
jgi:hypothetical protein